MQAIERAVNRMDNFGTGSGENDQHTEVQESVEVTVTNDPADAPNHKAGSGRLILMRDSKNPDGPVLAFTEAEWRAFIPGDKGWAVSRLGRPPRGGAPAGAEPPFRLRPPAKSNGGANLHGHARVSG